MFRRILFADDLSQNAVKGLEVALDLARKYQAELTILNVREDFLNKEEMIMLRVDVSDFQDDLKKIALETRGKIETDIAALGGKDVKTTILLREGKPAPTILDVAKEINADLMVIGRGKKSIKEKLFGAVSKNIIEHARCSVLVVCSET